MEGPGAPAAAEDETVSEPNRWLLLAAFTVLAVGMTFPDLSRFSSHVAGDYGDPMFVLWVLRWVPSSILDGWSGLWNADIFHPATNTLAYSENLVPMALLHWPLSQILGDVAAFNLIYVASWVASLWFTYRLCCTLTFNWQASVVAAVGYTFATARLGQYGHHQLMIGCLFPLLVLALIRLFERPSVWRGVGVGATLALITLWASYYGIAAAFVTALIAGGYLLLARPRPGRQHLIALAGGAIVAGILIAPFAYQYLLLQQDANFRRAAESQFSAHPGDFLAVSPENVVLDDIEPFETATASPTRSIENRLFPGIVTLAAAGLGVVGLIAAMRRKQPEAADRRTQIVAVGLIVAAGIAFFALSFGESVTFAGRTIPMPYRILRHVPGLAGIRVTARFFVVTQLALAVLAAIGITWATRRLAFRARTGVMLVLVAFVVVETATTITTVRVPSEARYGAVNAALARRPEGVVLELPIRSAGDGAAWAYIEAPRQSLAPLDGDERVNGYSGFEPPGFGERVTALNTFPSSEALAEADRLGVRYIVLRTELVGDLDASLRAALRLDELGRYTEAEARTVVAGIPPERVEDVTRVPGAYIVELARPGTG